MIPSAKTDEDVCARYGIQVDTSSIDMLYLDPVGFYNLVIGLGKNIGFTSIGRELPDDYPPFYN